MGCKPITWLISFYTDSELRAKERVENTLYDKRKKDVTLKSSLSLLTEGQTKRKIHYADVVRRAE